MSTDLALLRRWIAARIRMILRTRRALMFTLALPLVILLLFGGLNSGNLVNVVGGGKIDFAQWYTPSIAIFSLCSACYSTVIIGLANARDRGLLKRVRGTPLPMATYVTSWLVGAALTGIASVVVLFAVAVPALGVHVYADTLPAAVVTLALGAATLAALGLAVSSLVSSAEQAQPVAQLTFLPLTFISGIWWPLADAPSWLVHLADVFPLAHLVDAFGGCFAPGATGGGWAWGDLGVLALWCAGGVAVAARRFRWDQSGRLATVSG
jgi:ABC-2 type transport system permease protein